jgi:tetratricopeptide (TPR) repeat protein
MLLLLTACALHTGPLFDPEANAPPAALAETFAARDPGAVFDDALERRDQGDLEGATQRLVWLRQAGDTSPAVLYQLGVTYELAEDFEAALSVYDLLLSEVTDPGDRRDTAFRRAQVLESLGRFEDSLRQLKRLETPPEGFDFADRQTYDIQLGVAYLKADKPRRGRDLVEGGVIALSGSEHTYIQGKGLFALLDYELDATAALPLDGSDRKARKNVERRGLALLDAEQRLSEEIIPLAEPEWILAGCLAIGDAYVALGRDLFAAPTPKKLTAEQAAIYEGAVREKAAVLVRKAWTRYDSGLTYASRLGLDNRYTRTLMERRDNLDLDRFAER